MSANAPSQTVFSSSCDFHAGNGTDGTGSDNGNVFGITNYKDTTRNQTFTYDALNRVSSAQNAGTDCSATTVNGKTEYWGNNYGYDAWGNLLNKSVTKCSAENFSVAALANNQLSGYGYDAAGNMTSDPTDGVTLNYDQENRLTGAAGYTYTYDDDGNRIKKSNGTTGMLYWYMTPGIVGESDLSGNLQSEYVFFDGERVARKDFPSNAVSYYFSDHLKTASVITDSMGNIKAESDYYPWGGELQFSNTDSNHYKFGGHEHDSETGLEYYGARNYSNGLGRFLTPDWSVVPVPVPYADLGNPQSLNQYAYVGGNPASKVDPDGHQSNIVCTISCQLSSVQQMTFNTVVNLGVGVVNAAIAANNFFSSNNQSPPLPPPPSVPVNNTQTNAPPSTATTAPTAVPSSNSQGGTVGNATTHQTDFVVTPGGTAVPTDRDRIRDGFDKAGFPSQPATKTSESGTVHTVPTQGGPVDVRVMDGNASNPPRIVVSHPGTNNPKTPDGKATNNKADSHIPAQ
jgi:RHS repeat-associated protein